MSLSKMSVQAVKVIKERITEYESVLAREELMSERKLVP
jgi:hypothetical protein